MVDNISAILPTWGDSENAVEAGGRRRSRLLRQSWKTDSIILSLALTSLRSIWMRIIWWNFYRLRPFTADGFGLTEEDKAGMAHVAGDKRLSFYCTCKVLGEVPSHGWLLAESATVEGGMLNIFGTGEDSYIENFRQEQKITFNFNASLAGKYKMTIYYSANVNSGGGTVTFDLNGNKFDHEFAQTGGWAYYVYEDLGEVELKAGRNTLILTDKEIPNTYLINVKNISFEKID